MMGLVSLSNKRIYGRSQYAIKTIAGNTDVLPAIVFTYYYTLESFLLVPCEIASAKPLKILKLQEMYKK